MSLDQAQSLLHVVAPNLGLFITDHPDQILWKWDASGTYTSKSAYKIFS